MCKILFKVAVPISILQTHTLVFSLPPKGDMESGPAKTLVKLVQTISFSLLTHSLTHSTPVIPLFLSVSAALSHSSSLTPSLFPWRGGPQRQEEGLPYTPTCTHMCLHTHSHTHTCEALARPCLINDTRHCVRREGWVCDVWCGR